MTFDIRKTLAKAIKGGVFSLVGFFSIWLAKKLGIVLSDEQKTQIVTAVIMALAAGANLLKIKFPKQFGWL